MGKLVRDKIPDIIRAEGRHPSIRVLDDDAYSQALVDKLYEEVQELQEAKHGDRLEEAADVFEVLVAVVASLGSSVDDLVETAERKREARGGFDARLWLEHADPYPVALLPARRCTRRDHPPD